MRGAGTKLGTTKNKQAALGLGMDRHSTLWAAYKLRWNRRKLLFRAFRKRRQLLPISDQTARIKRTNLLLFCTFRNEVERLPYFLDYYRKLGVDHFLMVDNGSIDGSVELLTGCDDISVWYTDYTDELLVYPECDSSDLKVFTNKLDTHGYRSLGATMIDMYPNGRVGDQTYRPSQNPIEVLPWFDPSGYRAQIQPKLQSLWIQGGPRDRLFFKDQPERAPTLNKIPLVKWQKGTVYVTSTHQMLPRKLNHVFPQHGSSAPTGALLHTKFLPNIVDKSADPKHRAEHFANSDLYENYYDALVDSPNFWTPDAALYESWRDLEAAGLMQGW